MAAALYAWIAIRMGTIRDIKCCSRRHMAAVAIVEIQRLGNPQDFVKFILDKHWTSIYQPT